MRVLAVLLVALMILASVVSGTTYYVCDDGADCNAGDGSGWGTGDDSRAPGQAQNKATPWKTLQKAENTISSGDTVIVGDGIYTGGGDNSDSNVYFNENWESWTTFKSENLHGAVIDGEGTLHDCFLFDNLGNYVRMEGFECRNTWAAAVWYNDPDYPRAHHGYFYRIKAQGVGMYIMQTKRVSRVTFDSCLIYDTTQEHVNQHHAIYVAQDSSHVTIKNCVIYDCDDGWPIHVYPGDNTHDIVIEHNTLIDENPDRDGGIVLYGNTGGDDNYVVRNNIMYTAVDNPSQDHGISDSNLDSTVIIENNIMNQPTLCNSGCGNAQLGGNILDADLSDEFTDHASRDYTLRPDAESIDSGTATEVTVDYLGNPRDSLPDIGAYEYVAPDPRIAYLKQRFLDEYDHTTAMNYVTNDAVQMYFVWCVIDGLLSLYEATGNKEYVGYAVDLCKKYKSTGIYYDGDEYLDWYSSWYVGLVDPPYSHHHVEWRAGDGVARTVEAILTDPNLAEYEQDAIELRDFLEKHVWEKWTGGYSSSASTNSVTHFIGRIGIIALSLYKVTGDSEYLDYINTKGNELRDALVLGSNGAYTWNCYTDGGSCTGGGLIDISHASDTVKFMYEAYEEGLVFDETDMERLRNTIWLNLWNGDSSNPLFNNIIDGSGGHGLEGKIQAPGWIDLSGGDEELQDLYYTWVQNDGVRGTWYFDTPVYGELARSIALSGGSPCTGDCCNGVAYNPSTQVCCSGVIRSGECCIDSDCQPPLICDGYVCTEPPEPPCQPDWVCSDWGDCVDGVQSRDCTDSNACGTTAGKPAEAQTCASGEVTVTVDSTYSGYSTDPIDDGVIEPYGGTSSTWASEESVTEPHWVEFSFSQSVRVENVTIHWAFNDYRQKFMSSQEVRVQRWDGTGFVDIATITNPSEVESSSITFPAVTTERLRLFQPANQGYPDYPRVIWLTEVDYGVSVTHPADTSEPYGCITMGELTTYINQWLTGSDVSMPEMMDAVTLWRSGEGCS